MDKKAMLGDLVKLIELFNDITGGALRHVCGPLKDFIEKCGGKNGERWLEEFKRFLRSSAASVKVWRTFIVGGQKPVELIRSLKQNGFEISYEASRLMDQMKISTKPRSVEVAKFLLSDWFDYDPTAAEIRAKIADLGYGELPQDAAPYLREQYTDQPLGEWTIVVAEPVDVGNGLDWFGIKCDKNGRCLVRGTADDRARYGRDGYVLIGVLRE